MFVRPAALGSAAVALLASALVSGCSGGSAEPTSAKSPPPSAQEVAYYRCLEANGVILEKRDDGRLRVDKDRFDADVETKAAAKCVDQLPPEQAAAPAPAEFLAKARKLSACVRENGFPGYPDPDPKTAQVELTAEQQPTYRTPEFQAAAKKCSSE
ncbi:hypothetical protein [Streptomyces sp. NBC_01294]|uniref:hypothetical protein n=1 Tax=Streptomyces sp. NBC_01294 TaxID=2903815 RepID=UPI002DD8E0E6|nr:hypothetical protein [Streptomyces sp. NBC_01294]WRZ58133.1 hypothetical protein OG534_17485 [Streptomyces sp. NBC_01294]